jgi:NAD(P)-dependent dehydrogenase (short-subunit alcohol dehydrogenase family)
MRGPDPEARCMPPSRLGVRRRRRKEYIDAVASPLEKKPIVVTGGGGGLGGAVVDAFVAAGAICYLPHRGFGAESRRGVEVVGGVDLANETEVAGFYALVPPLWASIHLAGGYGGAPFVETTLHAFHEQLEMNLTTTFLCCREAVRSMKRSGAGRIVNVCSKAALVPSGGAVAYAAAKAGVAALTRSLAEEVRSEGILVNAVAPSLIDTVANRSAMPKADFSRWPKPSEIAKAILWLASPENSLTSGSVFPVYGAA